MSPCAHCVLRIKDAPMYSVDDNADCIPNIDQYIASAIPGDEGKLKDPVLLLQQHKHSSYAEVTRLLFPFSTST